MRRKTDKLVVLCTALCILCAAVVVGFVAPTVIDSSSKADAAQDTTAQIQAERARNVLDACRDQNRRHDRAVTVMNEIFAGARGASPEQIKRSLESTNRFIDALAPERDCAARVRSQVGPSPTGTPQP